MTRMVPFSCFYFHFTGNKLFFVEEILDKRHSESGIEYLVKWFGFSTEEATWEPVENVTHCPVLVDKFEKGRKSKAHSKKIPYTRLRTPSKKISKLQR